MSRESILCELKSIIPDLVDLNGNFRVTPIGWVGKQNLMNSHIKFLDDFITLLKTTSIITSETRMYIFDKYITMQGVNDELNKNIENDNNKVRYNNTMSKIQYDKNKLNNYFGAHLISDVMSNNTDISNYERTLGELFIKQAGKSELRDNLLLHLNTSCMTSELSDEKFEEFRSTIMPYIKSQVTFIENNIDTESCGYFNYLLSMPTLNDIDKKRLGVLKDLLGGEIKE